ncbi:hypothetical protein AX14_008455 [Amanita brunnescens Koide BX004]|nr:hypothetical protein AX14_008455 [Amanita brunnescens Koide BX004]
MGVLGDKAELAYEYEILQFSPDQVRWVSTSGTLNPANLNAKPVEGGHEENGVPLFIARANYNGGVHPGKAGPEIPGAQIAYGDNAVVIPQYEVLCYA